MNIAIIAALAIVCTYLFKRLQDTRAENVLLVNQVASLKRQLSRLRQ